MPFESMKFSRNLRTGNSYKLTLSSNFRIPIATIWKDILQIKSLIIDNIHYIDFITFNISTFFFLGLLCWNWGASYTPGHLIWRQIQYIHQHKDTVRQTLWYSRTHTYIDVYIGSCVCIYIYIYILIGTFDVTNLYSNIPHELGNQAISFWIDKYWDTLYPGFNKIK